MKRQMKQLLTRLRKIFYLHHWLFPLPSRAGVLILLKQTKESRQRPYFTLAFGVLYIYAEIRKAFYWNAQPQKELLRSTGFGESPNKYRLAKWIAKRIACWNIWYQQALLATTTFAFEHLQPVNYAAPKLKPQLKIC